MNELFSLKQTDSFTTILKAYSDAGVDLGDIIDGGAGSGITATEMLSVLDAETRCFAFEPFPGNHRFFEGLDPRIILIKKALAETDRTSQFFVHSVVGEESKWRGGGFKGYSSVGYLTEQTGRAGEYYNVECVRADQEIPGDRQVGAVKLDLQGGELNALRGMTKLFPNVKVMWVEYSGQAGLADFIEESGFMLFDTTYMFVGDCTEEARQIFNVTKGDVALSTGRKAWFGTKKSAWKNYEAELADFKKRFGLVQTDLVCINRTYINEFIRAIQYLK
ncbi:MAG: FkbM family methyltransferase [Hyphomonas sp.]